MSTGGYKIRNQEGIYFITFAVVEWIDVFSRKEYRDIVINSLIFCQEKKGLKIYAWVIMTNHVHFIFSVKEGNKLSEVLRDFKKFTSVKILEAIQKNYSESRKEWMLEIFKKEGNKNKRNTVYQFWRQDNHPIELIDNNMIDQRLNYIHNNPVEAGIVENDFQYIYSSAKSYCGEVGLIKIENL
jgi:REP element-mobilizing transposase RayT